MLRFIGCLFILILCTLSFPGLLYAQAVTPMYCLGGEPCVTAEPSDIDDEDDEDEDEAQPSITSSANTGPTTDPCEDEDSEDSSIQSHDKDWHGNKYRSKRGGGLLEELLKLLIELIRKLFGDQNITFPELDNNEDENGNNNDDGNEDNNEDEEDEEDEDEDDPCDDSMPTTGATLPTPGVYTTPGTNMPTGQTPTTGVDVTPGTTGSLPAPSTIVVMPSGSVDATACTAPAGQALQDQDMSDSQLPWKRVGTGKVVINFTTDGVPADWVTEMQKGVTAWNRSACLDTRLVPTCQPNTNCVTVTVGDGGGDDGNFDAEESGGFTTAGQISLLSTLTGGEKTNVTIHEMGHAVGLRHRLTENVLMNGDTYDNVFDPDEIDMQNLNVLYGNQQ